MDAVLFVVTATTFSLLGYSVLVALERVIPGATRRRATDENADKPSSPRTRLVDCW